jgi:hypothetical protein
VISGLRLICPALLQPVESIEGRHEITNYVKQAGQDANNVDHAMMGDALIGGLQFAYNNHNLETAFVKG